MSWPAGIMQEVVSSQRSSPSLDNNTIILPKTKRERQWTSSLIKCDEWKRRIQKEECQIVKARKTERQRKGTKGKQRHRYDARTCGWISWSIFETTTGHVVYLYTVSQWHSAFNIGHSCRRDTRQAWAYRLTDSISIRLARDPHWGWPGSRDAVRGDSPPPK